jgi:hypothetical protein
LPDLRWITVIFDAINAEIILAFAVINRHNIRKECEELWIISTKGRIGQN